MNDRQRTAIENHCRLAGETIHPRFRSTERATADLNATERENLAALVEAYNDLMIALGLLGLIASGIVTCVGLGILCFSDAHGSLRVAAGVGGLVLPALFILPWSFKRMGW